MWYVWCCCVVCTSFRLSHVNMWDGSHWCVELLFYHHCSHNIPHGPFLPQAAASQKLSDSFFLAPERRTTTTTSITTDTTACTTADTTWSPEVVLLAAPPACGKSTLARRFEQGMMLFSIICSKLECTPFWTTLLFSPFYLYSQPDSLCPFHYKCTTQVATCA